MIFEPLLTPGCLRLTAKSFRDSRGEFVKAFAAPEYREVGLPEAFAEEYYSVSKRNVLRGMHFQFPPHEHAKLVACMCGSIRDVILDLRLGSPRYGLPEVITLDENDRILLYLPAGIAHGFLVLSESALVTYKVTSLHAPASDGGVRWDSIGVDWGVASPIISPRDASFPVLTELKSPFSYVTERSV